MARVCSICNKGTKVVQNRPHSLKITKRKQKVNLQWAKHEGKRVRVCANCLKTLHKK